MAARVTAVHRDALEVLGPQIAGRIRSEREEGPGGPPTVGDWVLLDRGTRRVATVLPRTSLFQRKAAGLTVRAQAIAANVDTLLIATSANQDFNVARLERYLALAKEAAVTPVILVTKADLSPDAAGYAARARALLPGLVAEAVDARDPDLARQLKPWLAPGQTLALLGSSGVGKSTVVNTLMGAALQATHGIREDDAKGRHTTTGRSLHRLATGAWLMDTPGMRELQIVDVASGVQAVFADVAALAAACRFSDCGHGGEPGCAVAAALADGSLDPARLKRYEKLRREERRNSEAIHEKRARIKGFGRMARASYQRKLSETRGW